MKEEYKELLENQRRQVSKAKGEAKNTSEKTDEPNTAIFDWLNSVSNLLDMLTQAIIEELG